MVLESSISVVFLFGVFVLGVWMALVPEPRWVNDGASLFDAWHVEARDCAGSAYRRQQPRWWNRWLIAHRFPPLQSYRQRQ